MAIAHNCRCTLLPVLTKYNFSTDISYDGEIDGMTYDEWKESRRKKKEPKREEHKIAEGKDISMTWTRRPDKFAFEIEDVINAQGFDGLPRVVSAEEFDAAVADSGIICKRGYKAPDKETIDAYHEQLVNGKWYVDCSNGGAMHGQGMYSVGTFGKQLTPRMEDVVKGYALAIEDVNAGKIETFTFIPNAKLINENEIYIKRQNMLYEITKNLMPNKLDLDSDDDLFLKAITAYKLSPEEMQKAFMLPPDRQRSILIEYSKINIEAAKRNSEIPNDNGVFAAMLGYDAIQIDQDSEGSKYFVVLNRTACIFME